MHHSNSGDREAVPLWVPPGHFYSPVPDPREVLTTYGALFEQSARELPGIDLDLPGQARLLGELAQFYGEEDFPRMPRAGRRYCLDNTYFGYGDAFAYYALLRKLRPRRVIEVGAGWSSAVLLDTDERFLHSRTQCTFVEPHPERLLALLSAEDRARTQLLPQPLQAVPLAHFLELEAGDILFLDSSHVSKTGSDVNHAVFEILPRLAHGVFVHVHDIGANFEYPRPWVEEGRAWNEAYLLRAFLMHNPEWHIELHGPSIAIHFRDEVLARLPRLGENPGASLWLRRV